MKSCINVLFFHHHRDAALGQQPGGAALIVITAAEKAVAQGLGRDALVGGDAARLLLFHHHLAMFGVDVDGHVKFIRHYAASFHSFLSG